jgi:peptidoglycan/LPS O-acetylase OafA/YrhL
MTLAERMRGRDNHLTLIRLVLSLLVIFSHTFSLGGFGDEMVLGGNDKYGNLAVNGFFVLSGMLIAASFVRTKSLYRFMLSRCLRIFPGYWMSLLLTALVLCPFVFWLGGGELAKYWSVESNSPFGYVAKNLALKVNQTRIGELFANNPYPHTTNGVIWTLIYEFICYGFVVVVGAVGALRKHWLWPATLAGLMVVNALIYAGLGAKLPAWAGSLLALLHFLAYFVAGMMAYVYGDRVRIGRLPTLAATAVLVLLLAIKSPAVFYAYHVLAPPLLVLVIFGAAYSTRESAIERRMPDLSYGLYIYGWVVQQSLVSLGVADYGFAAFLLACLALTVALAVFSYYGVERRFLRLKPG